MRATTLLAVPIILLLSGSTITPLRAAEPAPDDAGLSVELRRLDATLGRLVQLLERQLESGNAAVLMQRVQLMTSRMAPLEQELRAARSEQEGHQGELEDLELAALSLESQMERETEEGQIEEEQARGLLEQQRQVFDARKKQIEDRLWAAQQRVIGLEQRLDARRTEIETWEGEIDRALGLR
jgi:chromosome segregation ATPase